MPLIPWRKPEVHPDPEWWMRLELSGKLMLPTDICDYCGHVREIHFTDQGCASKSSALMGHPGPCDCSNRQSGMIYRAAGGFKWDQTNTHKDATTVLGYKEKR